ncbi:MAG: hypothetical protein C4560_09825 [Nitrospiraceae bacterium]|nr:MAG: hypothetical protein C4560_09825 [Nitrospiraceae bacterium]
MKRILFMLIGLVIALSPVLTHAADITGAEVPGTSEQTDISTNGGEFCAQFDYSEGYNFILEVNSGGTGHTLGSWCQDWAPTGSVTVKDKTAKDKRIVNFDLSGTVPSDGCCDSVHTYGKYIYKLSTDTLKKAVVSWAYPSTDCASGPYDFVGKTKLGQVSDCR